MLTVNWLCVQVAVDRVTNVLLKNYITIILLGNIFAQWRGRRAVPKLSFSLQVNTTAVRPRSSCQQCRQNRLKWASVLVLYPLENCAPFVLSIVVWHCTRTLLLMLCSFCFLLNGLTDSITAAAFHLLLMIDTKKASMTLWPLSLSHTHTQQLQGKWTSMAPFAASYLVSITLGQPMFGSLFQPRFSSFFLLTTLYITVTF